MQNIERYGLVALVFLVMTVGAVLIWNHSKDGRGISGAKGELVADAPAPGALEDDSTALPERVVLHAEPTGRALRESSQTPGTLDIGATGTDALGAPGPEMPLAADPAAPIASSEAATEAAPRIESTPVEPAPLAAGRTTPLAADPATARPAAPEGRTYVVRASDTLSEISQRELGSSKRWPEIVAMNPGLEPARLQAGVKIHLPAKAGAASGTASSAKSLLAAPASKPKTKPKASSPDKVARTYRVVKGDSLWKVAARTLGDGNRWKEIADLNPKIDPDRLVEGQTLVLPGAGRSSEPLVAAATPSTRQAAAGAPVSPGASPRKERRVR